MILKYKEGRNMSKSKFRATVNSSHSQPTEWMIPFSFSCGPSSQLLNVDGHSIAICSRISSKIRQFSHFAAANAKPTVTQTGCLTTLPLCLQLATNDPCSSPTHMPYAALIYISTSLAETET